MLKRLSDELSRIIMLPDVSVQMLELGFESVGWDQRRTGAFLAQQYEEIRKLVGSGRVKP